GCRYRRISSKLTTSLKSAAMLFNNSAYTTPISQQVPVTRMATTTNRTANLDAVWRRSRRAAVGQLLAAASLAALGIGRSGADAPVQPDDESAPLADLGMELSPQQRAAGVAFLGRHASV